MRMIIKPDAEKLAQDTLEELVATTTNIENNSYNLVTLDLSGCDLSYLDFEKVLDKYRTKPNIIFDYANLSCCNFGRYNLPAAGNKVACANFIGVKLNLIGYGMNFVDCDFRGCQLTVQSIGASVGEPTKFSGCNFDSTDLSHRLGCSGGAIEATFVSCDMNDVKFTNQTICSVFENCELRNADFSRTCLCGSTFVRCDCTGCNFEDSQTNVDNDQFIFAGEQTEVQFVETDLSDCNFTDQQKEDMNDGI